MRRLAIALVVAACGHPAPARAPQLASPMAPRLLAPYPGDPKVRGAGYLAQVALQLQPGWGQFLDDCRLRLPAKHELNDMRLAATAELTVDARGQVTDVEIATSGNADFDRAVRDAIADAEPLVAPPPELWSDDDRVHLRWLFARDRRQAGPATAEVREVELPLREVVDRLVRDGDLARAARRIARAPDGGESDDATVQLMTAALREALGSADGASRRTAVEAIGRAKVNELADDVRALLSVTSDSELRIVAAGAAADLGDAAALAPLRQQLAVDLAEHDRLAVAEARALVRLGHAREVVDLVGARLGGAAGAPHPIALQVLGAAPLPLPGRVLGRQLAQWFTRGDAGTREAVCTALGGVAPAAAWPLIARGLGDGDATVRVTCTDAARTRAGHGDTAPAAATSRLRELARDRDQAVRAHAIGALAVIDPSHVPDASTDAAAEVRAAYAGTLAAARGSDATLRALIDDRDADVRAAAWATYAAQPGAPADRAQLAAHAIRDPAPQVRLAALGALDDDDALRRLASADEAPDVRTAALVQLAGRRGRRAVSDFFLERFAAAPAGSGERVRIALAWLLAR